MGYFLDPLFGLIWFSSGITLSFPFLAYSGIAQKDLGWFLGIFRNSGLALDNKSWTWNNPKKGFPKGTFREFSMISCHY